MKHQEKFQKFNQIDSLKANNQIEQFVFYDPHLQDIQYLLEGSKKGLTYIPVERWEDLFEIISTHLIDRKNVDIALLAHGTSQGINIGREFVDDKYISKKRVYDYV